MSISFVAPDAGQLTDVVSFATVSSKCQSTVPVNVIQPY